MNSKAPVLTLSTKAKKESMLPIDKLEKLVGEPDSGIEKVRQVVHVAIHPKYVNNIPLGLVNHFNKQINQWHPQLNGILAGYGRLQLKRPTGSLIHEEAHIHLDVQSDFWLFRPLIGRQLKGVVSKKSPTHVSCLVHGVFNVPCHKPPNVKEWWGVKAKMKQVVRLTVLKTDMSQKVPFILGNLQNIGLDGSEPQEMVLEETVPSPLVEEVSDHEWSEMTNAEPEPTSSPKKSKKSRKTKEPSTVDESTADLDNSEVDKTKELLISSILNESISKKKKKKKDKEKEDKSNGIPEEPEKAPEEPPQTEADRTKELLISSLLNDSISKKKKKKKDKDMEKEVEFEAPSSPVKRKTMSPIKETPARKKSKKEVSFDASTPIVEKMPMEDGDMSLTTPDEPGPEMGKKTKKSKKEKKEKKEKKKEKGADLSNAQEALIIQMLKNMQQKK